MGKATFTETSVLSAARAVDGLDNFGDPAFLEPLRALLAAYREAPVNDFGASLLHGGLVRSLANRARVEYWFAEYPAIAEEEIASPVVVVGMMRSGTTLMQRLLACDPEHACTLGWEAMEPAPRLGTDPTVVTDPDPRIAVAETREEQARTYTPELFAIHPSYAHQAEEEIMFMADAFLSHVPESYCDLPSYREWINDQDFVPAYRHLYRTLQLLQWQKRHRGETCRRWVLKTPAHLGYLPELFDQFPGAHVVQMHRNPVATIASGASLNSVLWGLHSDSVDKHRVGRLWLGRMAWSNSRALAARAEGRVPEDRIIDVQFVDLVDDPSGSVQHVYHALGLETSQRARDAMVAWLAEDQQAQLPTHRYRLEDFGLTAAEVEDAFSGYIARFHNP
ncbi:MAG: sulfotransferase [Pseudomonadota bacterium]